MTVTAKRLIDIVASSGGLILTMPIQAATALAIRATMGRPVLFRQRRPGLHGEPFEILKFRTMAATDPNAPLEADGQRLTPLGIILRSTSLDELPTLWNVLRGDMSIVGPRPLLMQYLERYSPEQSRRHDVRPGLTGLAQVNGRNAISWHEKFCYDLHYVDNHSLVLDARIIARTVRLVVQRYGVSAEGSATMPEFVGN
ncbi:sugar transferase [Ornithinimicrobium faecis]|uniref:Sugar transferase n=1 Tax=Ornithinimicrobium faecis TaxID=2934158 RepID=A0ABY4YT45_9MICO|nr:sugar transferase [Ornithinimicrobium sp. HY1793]USQ79776.1 sugar transferase [Ornithinimicrobium sp. HY1793]